MIKLFTNNYEKIPDVQLKLAQLQESMGLAYSLPQLFLDAAMELHKEGKQAIQDFNKTKVQLIMQQSGMTADSWFGQLTKNIKGQAEEKLTPEVITA